MIILPAIDLRGGRCVRLRQGRFEEETVYDEDPVARARDFEAKGAEWLHVVDLDGARTGEPKNLDRVCAIRKAVAMKIEVGGGIRSTEVAEKAIEAGADRIVVGTRAVREPKWLEELAKKFPGRVVAWGLDTQNARVAVAGWGEVTEKTVVEIIGQVAKLRLAAIIYTDIERDGMMSGPNLDATKVVVKASPWPVIASGGVTTVEDIRALKEAGAAGAIVGRALYEGKLTLEAALAAAAE